MKKYLLPVLVLMFILTTGTSTSAQVDPIITATFADLTTDTLHIEGINLPPAAVYMGKPGGGAEKLTINSASGSMVEAQLKTTAPGTYTVALVQSASVFWTGTVTIPSAGGDYDGGDQDMDLDAVPAVVRSVTIDAPTAGHVVVHASGMFNLNNLAGGPRCSLTTGTTIDFSAMTGTNIAIAGIGVIPFSTTRGFPVTAGPATINLVCDEFSGTTGVFDTQMTAIFFEEQL